MRLLRTKRTFKKEFKRQLRYAIAAACGFLIAYAWREAIISSTREMIEKIAENAKIATTTTGTALVITIVGVLIILLSSRLLREK